MNATSLPGILLLPWIVLATSYAGAANVEDAPLGEAVERHLTKDNGITRWVQDPDRIDTEMGDTLEMRETVSDALDTVKLSDLVAPIRFESGVARIPAATVQSLGAILERMRDRINVRLHLIGHADTQALSPRLAEIYGDNAGLSRERAGQVAEHFQNSLSLPPEAISFEWAGDAVPVASNFTAEGRALNRRVEVEVWYDEVRDQVALEEFLVPHEIERVKVCRMETVCKLRYVNGHARRARIQNLIAPLHFETETVAVKETFVERIRQGFENLAGKENVVVKFIGYTDDSPLTGRTARIYGDHVGLTRARARRVALAVQDSLILPTAAIESDGRGVARPLGSNATADGRALNRRIEVEFWYDDPLQELPDEPQLCPEADGAELVTRIYSPPWGQIADVDFVDGKPVLPPGYTDVLARALQDIADKTNPRLRFVGYTRNERLARRTAAVYGDDIGLSSSRARRAMERVAADMQLEAGQSEFEGRGYVHSDDVVNAGFEQGDTSHVAVRVVYDELAVLDDYDGVDVTRITRELSPQNPLGLNLMRITVNGEPIDDPQRSSSDIQRCTDVALKNADIQFGFDNMRSAPRLSVTAKPERVTVGEVPPAQVMATPDDETTTTGVSSVQFRIHTNYSHFIERAEVRIFENGQSLEAVPLDVVAIDVDKTATWEPPMDRLRASVRELAYVVRAYGADGNFDETGPQPLWVIHDSAKAAVAPDEVAPDEVAPDEVASDDVAPDEVAPDEVANAQDDPALFAAYGVNDLALHNIGLGSGTVSVRGSGIGADQEVWVAGRPIPVDPAGRFVAEEILPEGAHTVEVAVVDKDTSGELYLRDLEFKPNDWFYVAMADLTLSANRASGPIDLLQGQNSVHDPDSNIDGRLAFFVNGKFGDHWKLKASADTGEAPLSDLFSNFMEKSPGSLFRRLDPDYYYPTFGDDATVEELAPSMGKFFVRLSKGDDYGQWGNFKVGYMNNELGQVDRGLYGANLHYQSDATTGFGDRRLVVDGFAAEPGTIASREEFRGTGGSVYFLQRQDLLAGSERVRIEVRDKASGIVTGVLNLTPVLDYDIDYLQGRILLTEPLASTAEDNLLVRSGAVSGDEAHLVVRYEYTPGFDELDALSTGGQAHYWFGDHVKLGFTVNANEQDDSDSSLTAADLTVRLSEGTWLKFQQARSEGLVSLPQLSSDGGFGFNAYDPASFVDARANADRVDLSVRLGDYLNFTTGKLSMYSQDVEAGFSAPGLTALTDGRNYGGAYNLSLADRVTLAAKVDNRIQTQGIETRAQEFTVGYQISDHWDLSVGYRTDDRKDQSVIVPFTQEQGERTDAVIQVGYDPKSTWNAYVFKQDTRSITGDRRENSRTGIGGSFRLSEKLRVDTELSDGDLGAGGRLGTSYAYSDQTNMYLNYALEAERSDNGLASDRGSEGNLVAGLKSRIADSASVFLEERYQHNDRTSGLTHGTGISFAPTKDWTLGITTDIGTLQDVQTGAETDRQAGGIQLGFASDDLQVSSGIEYRNDDVQQPDLARTERTTWLYRNNIKFQISPAARLLGKLNHSDSESSLGTFYDGGYTEAVAGLAYRPISHDRLNALAKYTYFYNVPTTEQIGLQNIPAEFIQKSHIAAVDVSYDFTPRLTLGGKYAYRLGQVSLDRDSPEFFDNNAGLFVIRGDYRIGQNWELLAEGRLLDMSDLDERRSGVLATVSRYVGDHLKIGLGYNFTDFSDDLTDLSFDHQGLFLNMTGSL